MTVRLGLVIWLAALVGCSAEDSTSTGLGDPPQYPVPGCEALDHSACDVRDAVCQGRLFALAACLRGEDAGELPPISIMSQTEYAAYLRAWFAEQPPLPKPNHYEQALVLIGLIQPAAFSTETTIAERVERVGGFYDPGTKSIAIIDHLHEDSAQVSYSLVHEFIHFLQDREVDLGAFREEHANSYDSRLALDSVIEGEATLHTSRYEAALLGLDPSTVDWTKRFESSVALAEAWIVPKLSSYTDTRSAFPYHWGARKVHSTWKAQGQSGVLALYAAPPQTSREFMLIPGATDHDDFVPSDVSSPVAGPEWSLWTDAELGAWGTFLMLTRASQPDVAQARELALGWRGDMFSVYAHDVTADTALVWRLEFVDTSVATKAFNRLRIRDNLSVQQQGTRVVVAAAKASAVPDWAFEL